MTCHDKDCRAARLWAAERIAALEAERDAALARVAELEAEVSRLRENAAEMRIQKGERALRDELLDRFARSRFAEKRRDG
jgi:cell division protein FtsB